MPLYQQYVHVIVSGHREGCGVYFNMCTGGNKGTPGRSKLHKWATGQVQRRDFDHVYVRAYTHYFSGERAGT